MLSVAVCGAISTPARVLTFEDRLRAEEAISRVYHKHRDGSKLSFREAYPSSLIEKRVRTYLRQGALLERRWKSPLTAETLRRETLRILASSKMPGRLRELFRALGDDPLLIQECLVRPEISDRLARAFLQAEPGQPVWSTWWPQFEARIEVPNLTIARADQVIPSPETTPADGTWDNGVLDDAPEPRASHSAVWTGSEMVVWGGGNAWPLASGGRYDPVTDSWTPTSALGAPEARGSHVAVWTGNRMLIFGGYHRGTYEWPGHPAVGGGLYDPVTDRWTPIATVGAPSFRDGGSYAWTGSELICWGGASDVLHNDGARFNVASNSWTPMSTEGAPAPRYLASAVWTGREFVVWGGYIGVNEDGGATATGGRYDPATDTWLPVSMLGAPNPRYYHSAIWTGHEMLVWGGLTWGDPSERGRFGGRYDPNTDTWTLMSDLSALPMLRNAPVVWTGSEMLVWGGENNYYEHGFGAAYNPVTDSWQLLNSQTCPSRRYAHTLVWTGSAMIVWGGLADSFDGELYDDGARYDPVSDTWTPTWRGDNPAVRGAHTAVWTGSEMIVWGGYGRQPATSRGETLKTGGRYDPALDSWRPTTEVGAPTARRLHTAVWTGRWMIVWGGDNFTGTIPQTQKTGSRYDPIRDEWRPMANLNAPMIRSDHMAVWTGRTMIVWGGYSDDRTLPYPQWIKSGGAYDPVANRWTAIATPSMALGNWGNCPAVWTGDEVLFWGAGGVSAGLRYDPAHDSWRFTSSSGAPSARYATAGTWTGNELIVWGGADWNTGEWLATGGRYDPEQDRWTSMSSYDAPAARDNHVMVWSGTEALVWGGFGPRGGRYSPTEDRWQPIAEAPRPTTRFDTKAVWTGLYMMVWGGYNWLDRDFTLTYGLGDGGRYVVWVDNDTDGALDGLDNCPTIGNPAQDDYDGDGIGDACEPPQLAADADNSNLVNGFDLGILGRAFGRRLGEVGFDPRADFDRSTTIDGDDLAILAAAFGR